MIKVVESQDINKQLIRDSIEFLKCDENIYDKDEYYDLMSDSQNWDYYDEDEIEEWKKKADTLLSCIGNPSEIYYVSYDDEEGTYNGESDWEDVFDFISELRFLPESKKNTVNITDNITDIGDYFIAKTKLGVVQTANIMGYWTFAASTGTVANIIKYLTSMLNGNTGN